MAVCTLRNHNHMCDSNVGHPFSDQDEQEHLNQLRYDLHVPLGQSKSVDHLQSHRKAGILVHIERELGILKTTTGIRKS